MSKAGRDIKKNPKPVICYREHRQHTRFKFKTVILKDSKYQVIVRYNQIRQVTKLVLKKKHKT